MDIISIRWSGGGLHNRCFLEFVVVKFEILRRIVSFISEMFKEFLSIFASVKRIIQH